MVRVIVYYERTLSTQKRDTVSKGRVRVVLERYPVGSVACSDLEKKLEEKFLSTHRKQRKNIDYIRYRVIDVVSVRWA